MMRGAFNHPFDWAAPFFLYAEGDMPSYCWKTRLKVAMLPKPDCPAMDVIESSVRSRSYLQSVSRWRVRNSWNDMPKQS